MSDGANSTMGPRQVLAGGGGGVGGAGQVMVTSYPQGGGGSGAGVSSSSWSVEDRVEFEELQAAREAVWRWVMNAPLERLAAIPELHALEEHRRALFVKAELRRRKT